MESSIDLFDAVNLFSDFLQIRLVIIYFSPGISSVMFFVKTFVKTFTLSNQLDQRKRTVHVDQPKFFTVFAKVIQP